ncbi:photosystem i p700 chlorophyll a apoprotein a1, partial [Phtheirospermum japonicum]
LLSIRKGSNSKISDRIGIAFTLIGFESKNQCTDCGTLVFAALILFAGWFHYHKAAPKWAWFQDVESMLNHHLAGLLGLGSLSWAGHQVHVSLPIKPISKRWSRS